MKIEQWSQYNNGDKFGTLFETRNCNLDKAGVIKLSNKAVVTQNDVVADGGDTAFDQVLDIETFGTKIYPITDDEVFKGDVDGGFFTSTGTVSLNATASSCVCYDRLYVTDDDDVHWYSGSTWTQNVITGLDAGSVSNMPHILCVFDSLPTYKLAASGSDSNKNAIVKCYNSSHSASSTVLTLPANYIITSMVYRNGYLYIGTRTDNGQEAQVFVWNGETANADFSIPIGASWVLSMVPYKSTVAGITNEGELFAISGSQKQTLAGLPVYYTENTRWVRSSSTVAEVVHGGMSVIGDRIYISVEADLHNNAFIANMIDGVWCYDPAYGLYHYASPTVDILVTDGSLSVSNNEITTSTTHNLVTGDPVGFYSVSGLGGVDNDRVYYAIVTGTNTLKLAGNRYDAEQGNAITITGTAGLSDKLVYAENTDKGTLLDAEPGAILSVNHQIGFVIPGLNSDVVFGAAPYNLSDTKEYTLQAFTNAFNVGWFATQKIYTSEISTSWQDITLFVNGLLLSNESVIIKYRTEERSGVPTKDCAIEWTSAIEFTTTDPAMRNNVQVGDEVVFLRGRGQGQTAHITAVQVSSGTTTVTIDESYGNAGDSAKAYVTNYKKLGTMTSTRHNNGYGTFSINQTSPWVQVKVEMRGFNIEVSGINITSNTQTRAA